MLRKHPCSVGLLPEIEHCPGKTKLRGKTSTVPEQRRPRFLFVHFGNTLVKSKL